VIERVEICEYGEAAHAALRAAVARRKSADLLAPLTVVVPSNFAGLAVRRSLAAGGGVANAVFVTPPDLAARLARGRMHEEGRLPISTPVVAAAVRRELREAPGVFGPVAGHPATDAALLAAYEEIALCRSETVARLVENGSERARGAVELLVRAHAKLAEDYFDDADVAAEAMRAIAESGPEVRELGAVILFLPQPMPPAVAEVVAATLEHAPSEAVVGLAGDEAADADVRRTCGLLGVELPELVGPPLATGTDVIDAPDPDEEVRQVLRGVLAEAERGTPLDRIGVMYATAEPYARTLHEQLDAADVPHNQSAIRALSHSVVGRTLLRLLELRACDYRREAVGDLLLSAPLFWDGRRLPGARWELLSRRAGITGGRDDWDRKLTAFATSLRALAEREESEGAPEGRVAGLLRSAAYADELRAFVDALADELEAGAAAASWATRVERSTVLLGRLLGDERARTRWPDDEQRAYADVELALTRLATLDRIEQTATEASYMRAVETELAAPMSRLQHFGEGVWCGPLVAGVGLDLDVVFLVGMAEGTCPSPARDDTLLPDADRALAVAGELPLRALSVDVQHRSFLVALAAGRRRRVLLAPRGDHRTGRSRLPSRWVLDTITALTGSRVYSSDYPSLECEFLTRVSSFTAGLRAGGVPASPHERDLAALLRFAETGGDIAEHPAASGVVRAAVALVRARRSSDLTCYDGDLESCAIQSPATGDVLSPTRLETWAKCPFQYFLGRVLRLDDVEAPEQILDISPLERGNVVHKILERFVGEAIDEGWAPGAGEPWGTEAAERLDAIAHEVFDETERSGLTGKPVLWSMRKRELRSELQRFLREDDGERAVAGARPVSVEMPFGLDGAEPVHITLPSGRSLDFHGRADRIDECADGRVRVIDYKTGRKETGLAAGDPVAAGTRLQLPLYAEAAAQRFGAQRAEAYYWFVSTRGDFDLVGYELDDDRRARFHDVLETIVDGVEAGSFPMNPGDEDTYFATFEQCRRCDFDRICPVDRLVQADAKSQSPKVAGFRSLAVVPEEGS
jgi:RecB family exonuclease